MDTSTDLLTQAQSTGKHQAHLLPTGLSSEPADTGSPTLHRSKRNSITILSDAGSDMSDRPPLGLYTEEGELSEDPD